MKERGIMPMELLEVPLVGNVKGSDIPEPEVYTYWKSRKSRTFYIDYEIDEDYSLVELAKIIIQMNIEEKDVENPNPIRLFIHSYGGDIEQALFFCDLVKSSKIPVITIGMGVAMSAGFLIFLSGKKRYAFEHTSMLVHSGSAAFQGTAEQIEEAQKNYKKQIEQMKSYILANTSIDEKTFNKNRNKDWYLSSDELLKYGVIDEIITNLGLII